MPDELARVAIVTGGPAERAADREGSDGRLAVHQAILAPSRGRDRMVLRLTRRLDRFCPQLSGKTAFKFELST
jgi:hypothetical protein